jgi:glycosyltransferase involved in cell wall biosynthesis
VDVPGFVSEERIDAALRRALCLVLPSRREGYGLVVIEAAARGVPSVVVAANDNAAVELVEQGVNGVVAFGVDAHAVSSAIVEVQAKGSALRASAAAWFEDRSESLSITGSLDRVVAAYR